MGPSRSPSPSPPPGSFKRKVRPCARKVERGCCLIATYFPLAFVYGLTTWAVLVDASLGLFPTSTSPDIPLSRRLLSLLGVTMYVLLNTSYTVAVFTDPGSPSQGRGRDRGRYSVLPTSENYDTRELDTITVSSTGGARYCKKCQVPKPDRTHHCSTCKRCVLKMDHHCPWLSTCLGLHNYKAFLLFLIYTSLFCWSCFAGTGYWIYIEIFSAKQYLSQFAPVQTIILAVLSGIIGLVITGFTAWHIYLVLRGQTTIECLEKTRYLSGVRKRVEQVQNAQHMRGQSNGIQDTINRAGGQLLEFHANAVPGALRYEEGEEHRSPTPSVAHPYTDQSDTSPAQRALRKTYASYESDRERERYEEYLEDKESAKMPNAFDLGWRRNLFAVLGPNPWFWFLPITNSPGDGWRWEVSQKWMAANEEAARRKERRIQDAQSSFESPNRGGAGRHYDLAHDEDFGLSMQNLRGGGGRRQRRDFDTVDGETGSFVVSDSEESSES